MRALACYPHARWHVGAPTKERVTIGYRAHERRPFSGFESRCPAAAAQTDLESGTKACCGARGAKAARFLTWLVPCAGCECRHMHLPAQGAVAVRARRRRCTRVVFVTRTADEGDGLTPPRGCRTRSAAGASTRRLTTRALACISAHRRARNDSVSCARTPAVLRLRIEMPAAAVAQTE